MAFAEMKVDNAEERLMKRESKLLSMCAATMAAALSAFGAGVTGDDAKGAVTG